MKKLYILLALLMALGMTWAVAETYTNEDWDYTLLEDGTAEIVSYSGGAVELIIPSELDGYTITSIGDEAFYGCTELTCITIPDSITNIGVAPFDDCWELTEFLISPEHPRLSAVEGVLFDTKEKRLIFYPASCTAVSYEIPFGTKIIGKSAFDCSELVSITIPQSVTTIEDEAFSNCRSLTSITIPDSTKKIGTNPFIDCSSLAEIKVSIDHPTLATIDGVLFEKKSRKLICYPDILTAGSYVIPQGIKIIGEDAFYNNPSLREITIPDSLVSIENNAFYCCRQLSTLSLPDSITSIGDSAFFATGLTSVRLPAGLTRIGNYAFYFCDNLASIQIPESVTSIGLCAFYGCSDLQSVALPQGLTELGQGAFYDCKSLTSIVIPAGVKDIYHETFHGCTALTSVTIEEGVAHIDFRAFYDCTALTSLSLPKSLTRIDTEAFVNVSPDLLVTVYRSSYAASFCKGRQFNYTYHDLLDWLTD